MTRTSKALKRLGVAGVVAATIGAGVPAFFATAASAATTTGITLSPKSQAATVNTCVAYTAQITPAEAKTVDVQISQTTTTGTAATPAAAGPGLTFCDPDGAGAAVAPAHTTTTSATGNVTSTNGAACPVGAGGSAASPQSTTTCDAEFTTNASGSVTFGVQSDTVGTVNITAFVEDNPANPGLTGNATPANGNATGNNVPNVGEQSDTATLSVVAAGNASVKAITCTPTTRTSTFGVAKTVSYTCTAYTTNPSTGANTLPVSGAALSYFVTAGPDKNASGNCPVSASGNPGEVTCTVTNTSGQAGTDSVLVYAEQNGAAGPQSTETSTTVTANFVGGARNIACNASPATATVGGEYTVDCLVTDVNGKAVPSKNVNFTLSGAGRYSNLNCYTGNACQVSTGTDGHAQVSVTSATPGKSTVLAELASGATTDSDNPASECNSPAGSTRDSVNTAVAAPGSTAGNCSATSNVNFVTSQSPSPSPSATSTATTPPAGRQALTLTVNTPVINAGTQGRMTVSGTAGQSIQLVCYTRPSTTYTVARNATIDSAGSPVTFTLALGMNTRCFAQYATNSASGASASNVINVRTVVSIFPVRKSFRNYVFQGHNMPKYAGQLITLYYQSNAGTVRKGYVKTDSTGIYYIPVKFVGSGTFTFFVRTGQTLTNAAGESAHVSVNVH